MPTVQTQQFCQRCGRPTLHAKEGPNNLIHFFATLFLCGLWLPFWGIVIISSWLEPYRCQQCGTAPGGSIVPMVFVALVTLILLTVFALFVVSILQHNPQ